jgi:NADPH-dependent 2,4-dienoyl-CoA reductase/sulfur reductase-like enzyme
MGSERLAIVGGDAAGMSAASAARRRDPDLEVVAFERGPYTSYSACGIPFYVGGLVEEADRLISRSPRITVPTASTCARGPRFSRSTSPRAA